MLVPAPGRSNVGAAPAPTPATYPGLESGIGTVALGSTTGTPKICMLTTAMVIKVLEQFDWRWVRRCCRPLTLARSPVHDYPRRLLRRCGRRPRRRDDPTVVVLTPGVYNSAYFEHALLARMMGVELVEGRDLVCAGGQVRMRTTQRRAAGRRHLPPGRRRVPRPGALPGRLGARRRRACVIGDARRPRHASPTRSATASPTTSSSTPTCPT